MDFIVEEMQECEMWEEHPNVFWEIRDVTIRGPECFQLPAFPGNGIDSRTRDVLATSDAEPCEVVACISNGNECLVSDACAECEANSCDSVRADSSIIVEKINKVLVPQLIWIFESTQSIVEVQLCSTLLDDPPFDTGSDTTKCVSHRIYDYRSITESFCSICWIVFFLRYQDYTYRGTPV